MTSRSQSRLITIDGDWQEFSPQSRLAKNPSICGGSVCIHGTRIPVWTLVRIRQLGCDESWILASYPQLTRKDLEAAWWYAERCAEEIQQEIKENEQP